MLVYSTTLWLGCELDDAVDIIEVWLSHKFKEPIEKLRLNEDTGVFAKGNDRLQSARVVGTWPQMQSIAYTQPDNKVSGRQWKTEISLRQQEPHDVLEVTIVLSKSDISTLVTADVLLTRPTFIRDLLDRCNPTKPTAGIQVWDIDESCVDQYLEHVLAPTRHAPIVLVSPSITGDYLVSPADILSQLGGIADVVRITSDANTFRIQQLVGDRFAAWRGAINIIFPPYRTKGSSSIYNRLFRADDIELMLSAVDTRPATELLSHITHRVNLPNSWRLVTIDKINAHRRHLELQHARAEASRSGEQSEYLELLEIENETLSQNIKARDAEIQELRDNLEAKAAELDDSEKQIEGLLVSLHYDRGQSSVGHEIQEIREAFIKALQGTASVPESLRLIEVLFPDRIFVLDTAHSSAKESEKFEDREKALELLLLLATSYWKALVYGNGDIEARKIFGDNFSASEGEAEKNRRAVELRTFMYKGEPVQMFKHLKLGVKPSPTRTLRVHFHWDSEAQVIVIGHCGKHLDHK